MASKYSIHNIPAVTVCVLLAWFAVEAAAKAEHYTFDQANGYTNGVNLTGKLTTVNAAKIHCRNDGPCKSFYHKGSPEAGSAGQTIRITFTDSEMTTVNNDEVYTSYIKIETCTATDFAHCTEDLGVKCCMSGLAMPRCGSKSECTLAAEKIECSNDLAVCPTMKGVPCCNAGRCEVTTACPQPPSLPLMEIFIGAGVLMACLAAITFWLCSPGSRKDEGNFEEGDWVSIHSDPKKLTDGTLVNFDEKSNQWNVRIRLNGRIIAVDPDDLVKIPQRHREQAEAREQAVEMQQPLAEQS
jgi:hypothetical protein